MKNYDLRDEVLARSDIVEIIGEHITLKKRGANYIGLCPFHNEKTPSFTVSPDKQIFKCFGCGKSGNIFTFLKDINGMSFREVLISLAERFGVPYEESNPKKHLEYNKKEIALQSLEFANSFYHNILYDKEGEKALKYLYKRGFTDDTIKKFELGYSLENWTALYDYLTSMSFKEEALYDAGLIISKTDSKRVWDRFRGRLMFPIYNQIGKVIGFGARDLSDKKDVAKYLNSPETIIYDKSIALYGIFNAKDEIRTKEYAILCEGYADVIMLYQAGFKNAIASCGTALTKGQLINIKRYTTKIYLSYDSDFAGINATSKAIELALPMGFDIKVINLPNGEDPDSYIKNNGKESFSDLIRKAVDFIEHLYNKANENNKIDSPSEKSKFIKYCVKLIYSIPDNLQYDFYIAKLSSIMHLSENQIKSIYRSKQAVIEEIEVEDNKNIYIKEIEIEEYREDNLLNEEKLIFEQIINDKESYNYCKNKLSLSSKFFYSDSAKNVYDMLNIIYEKYDNIATLFDTEIEELDRKILSFIIDNNFNSEILSDRWSDFADEDIIINKEKIINDSLLAIELYKIELQINIIKKDNNGIQEIEKLKMLSNLAQEKIIIKEAVANNNIEYLIEKYQNK